MKNKKINPNKLIKLCIRVTQNKFYNKNQHKNYFYRNTKCMKSRKLTKIQRLKLN